MDSIYNTGMMIRYKGYINTEESKNNIYDDGVILNIDGIVIIVDKYEKNGKIIYEIKRNKKTYIDDNITIFIIDEVQLKLAVEMASIVGIMENII